MAHFLRVGCLALLALSGAFETGISGMGVFATVWAEDAIQVSGRVLDAETGKPIPIVRVVATSVQGDNLKRGQVTWQMHLLRSFEGGEIDFRMERGYQQTVVRIDADGYRPFVTPVVEPGKPLRQDFKLNRDGIQGIVLTPDGRPAAYAEVAMSTWTLDVYVEGDRLRYGRDVSKWGRQIVETDASGRFNLPAETDPLTVVVAHETGFVQQPVNPFHEDSPTAAADAPRPVDPRNLRLTLHAWSRISGQLRGVEAKPVAGRKLGINGGWPGRNDPGHIHHTVHRVTDSDGRFSVDRVAPGGGTISHYFDDAEGNGSFAPIGLSVQFEVQPGQTLHLTPGQIEQPVTGKLVVPDELKDADLSAARFRVFLHDSSWKRSFGSEPVARYPGWEQFGATPEGKHYGLDEVTAADAPERLRIHRDGRFTIRGLPAARYVLQVRLEKGFAVTRFVVPLNSVIPVAVGELPLRLNQ